MIRKQENGQRKELTQRYIEHRVHREERRREIHRTKSVRCKSVPHPDEAYGAQNRCSADSVRNDGALRVGVKREKRERKKVRSAC